MRAITDLFVNIHEECLLELEKQTGSLSSILWVILRPGPGSGGKSIAGNFPGCPEPERGGWRSGVSVGAPIAGPIGDVHGREGRGRSGIYFKELAHMIGRTWHI